MGAVLPCGSYALFFALSSEWNTLVVAVRPLPDLTRFSLVWVSWACSLLHLGLLCRGTDVSLWCSTFGLLRMGTGGVTLLLPALGPSLQALVMFPGSLVGWRAWLRTLSSTWDGHVRCWLVLCPSWRRC